MKDLYNTVANHMGGSALTMDKIEEMLKLIPPPIPDPLADLYRIPRLAGMDVFTSPLLDKKPKFQLMQATVDVMSAEKAAEINAWLAEFFGYYDPQVLMCGPRLFMGVKVARDLRGIVNYNVA